MYVIYLILNRNLLSNALTSVFLFGDLKLYILSVLCKLKFEGYILILAAFYLNLVIIEQYVRSEMKLAHKLSIVWFLVAKQMGYVV
jgi:hypothetical protein